MSSLDSIERILMNLSIDNKQILENHPNTETNESKHSFLNLTQLSEEYSLLNQGMVRLQLVCGQ